MAREYREDGTFIWELAVLLTFKNGEEAEGERYWQSPMDSICCLETDCPYLAPVPNRGKSAMIRGMLKYVVQAAGGVKEVDYDRKK